MWYRRLPEDLSLPTLGRADTVPAVSEAVRTLDGRVQLAWRSRAGVVGVYYALPFALVLLYLAATSTMFETVHRTLFAVFAVVIGYFVAVQLCNATRLSVAGDKLRVVHGPLPWRASVELPLAEIRSVAVDRASARLKLRTRSGQEIDLVDGVPVSASDSLDAAIRALGVGRDR